MSTARESHRWNGDRARARRGEVEFARYLAAAPGIVLIRDATGSFSECDFTVEIGGRAAHIELKEKRQRYSNDYRQLAPDFAAEDLFILDETAFRRLVAIGIQTLLVVNDLVEHRWVIFDIWDLTLGPRVRFLRWGDRGNGRFAKGKLLLDLSTGCEFEHIDDLNLPASLRRAHQRSVDVRPVSRLTNVPEIGGRSAAA